MEQRIGPTIPPVQAAGTDPAFVPGFTPPRPVEAAQTAEPAPEREAEQTTEQPSEDAVPEDAVPQDAVPQDGDGVDGKRGERGERGEEDGDTGPVFEASDRRGSITADRAGITMRLDGEEAELFWDEIGAVEIDTARFARRLTVTVYTTGRRWYEAEITTSSRQRLKEWTAELDAVLDARFEEAQP
ncbi:hypothetical protein [Streptomyces sp. NPDC051569]|uniref:hypothetical protein n=1 Tax=Streptomyces sp. NPDC051569 TaxID=3365661 RepID=UPI0037B4FFDB